ncbi:High affinity nitrate transporter 2.7 [Linum grandiflorum]
MEPTTSAAAAAKSTEFNPFSLATPQIRAFHLAWISLFSNFVSTFSIPPLLPLIRSDLHLSPSDISSAAAASFAGSILSRLAMGPLCQLIGPATATASLSFLTSPAIFAASLISSPNSFLAVRLLIGLSLGNFVANQYWMSSIFSPSVVALANGISAGWANTGAGFAQFLMPQICSLLGGSWRIAFLFPGILQLITAAMVLIYGREIKTEDLAAKTASYSWWEIVVEGGIKDYRGWILGLAYGCSFGSELTTDNVIAAYFYDRFGLDLRVAGAIGAGFAVTNLFSRPAGGVVSDEMGRRFGERGRVWGLWVVLTAAGGMCVVLGRASTLWGSVAAMCAFSVTVQAASGMVFGVVPFVSKRSMGVIAGMTGSGGTVGAVLTQLVLFSGSRFSTQTSISLMGLMIILCTLPVTFIYFPPDSTNHSKAEKRPLLPHARMKNDFVR